MVYSEIMQKNFYAIEDIMFANQSSFDLNQTLEIFKDLKNHKIMNEENILCPQNSN
jgi:hypothetical protein